MVVLKGSGDRWCLRSMNGIAVYRWQTPLVVEASDEMYGIIPEGSCHPWIFLPSMEAGYP